ncbi:MAG: deoxynucleoside kinase [Bacteroidota bacterium]
MKYNFIAIEGNIGAGKSTLAGMIADKYQAMLINEGFEDNSFLPKFYKDPEKYAFPLELSFLAERYQQLKDKLQAKDLFYPFVVADYFIAKSLVFAKKTLPADEFSLYSQLFNIIISSLPQPDLIVYLYLKTEKLQQNIKKRGRPYEMGIEDDYLEKIQSSYFEYMARRQDLRILIVDTNNIDFVANPQDYQKLEELIFESEYEKGIHRIMLT